MASNQPEETCKNENCQNEYCDFKYAPSLPPLNPDEPWLCSGCTLESQLDSLTALYTESKIEVEVKVVEQIKKKASGPSGVIRHIMKSHVPKQREGEETVGIFEPTNGDIRVVGHIAADLCFLLRKGSLRQFHEILFPTKFGSGKDLRGTLYEVFDEDVKNLTEFKDQKKRAKKLVEVVDKYKVKKVYLLDGHGRTFLAIINAMIEKNLEPSSVKFVVVDIDKECHSFHKHFFPEEVVSSCMNVLDIDLGKNELAYLNFCSIATRVENIHFNKEEVLKWMWEKMQVMECPIMISTVIRDTRSEREKEKNIKTALGPRKGRNTKDCHLIPAGFKLYMKDEDGFQAEEVSIRDEGSACEFVTWLINPEICKAKESPQILRDWFTDDSITWDYKTDIRENTMVYVRHGKHTSPEGAKPDKVIQRTPCQVTLEREDPKTGEKKKINRVDIKNVANADEILVEGSENLNINEPAVNINEPAVKVKKKPKFNIKPDICENTMVYVTDGKRKTPEGAQPERVIQRTPQKVMLERKDPKTGEKKIFQFKIKDVRLVQDSKNLNINESADDEDKPGVSGIEHRSLTPRWHDNGDDFVL